MGSAQHAQVGRQISSCQASIEHLIHLQPQHSGGLMATSKSDALVIFPHPVSPRPDGCAGFRFIASFCRHSDFSITAAHSVRRPPRSLLGRMLRLEVESASSFSRLQLSRLRSRRAPFTPASEHLKGAMGLIKKIDVPKHFAARSVSQPDAAGVAQIRPRRTSANMSDFVADFSLEHSSSGVSPASAK